MPEIAARIRFLVKERGLYQHQAAALVGVNQGRISEIMRGRRYPDVKPRKVPSRTEKVEVAQHKRGRDADTGQFLPVKVEESRKATAIVETFKVDKQGKPVN